MMRVWQTGMFGLCLAGGAAVAMAQSPSSVPTAFVPPSGLCRVWLHDVPPMQQPAPTDCRSALRTKPVGATVIYGPEPKRRSFTPSDWSRPSARPARDDDRTRTPFRTAHQAGGRHRDLRAGAEAPQLYAERLVASVISTGAGRRSHTHALPQWK